MITLILLAACLAAPPSQVREKAPLVLRSFDLRGVTLDGGPLRRQLDEVREFYLRIPNDDLLKGFRIRAGRPAPGRDLGGWYTSDTFHIFGQVLSGLARLHAATGDPACRAKLKALVCGWVECIEPDGWFYQSRNPGGRHYIFDKLVGGLVDAWVYAGCREALPPLRRITGWALRNLDKSRPYGADPNEWYTLSENLYRAWIATGEPLYRDFARVWEYTEYWDAFREGRDIHGKLPNGKRVPAYHAYSHVNTLGGAAAAYRVTGNRRYLRAILRAYDYLQARQCFATGGYGPDEQLLPREALLARLPETASHFETQCGTWAAFKLARQLISFTGDARYGDWIERLVINGIGASLPSAADGRVYYYADYNPCGGRKVLHSTGWTCCAGTRPLAVAEFHNLIYFRSADSLCVNLYADSTVRWRGRAGVVRLVQRTRFPESGRVDMRVYPVRPGRFRLKLRAPGWLAGPMRVRVNGRRISAAPDRQRWVFVERVWRRGDRLEVDLPMGFHVERLDPGRAYPCAVLYGPVVLAFRSPEGPPAPWLPLAGLAGALVPSPGEPLTWHLRGRPGVLARAFHCIPEGETYYLYLDPAARPRIPHTLVVFSGPWAHGAGFRYTNSVGATAEVEFEGTGIRWLGHRFDDAGRAEVSIDGRVVAIVDQYGPGRPLPFDWRHEGLPPGRHTIRLRLLEEKHSASRDRFLNVAGFQVLGTPPAGN